MAFPTVGRQMHDGQLTPGRETVEDFSSPIPRAVVDDDDLALQREIDRQEPIDDRCDGRALVVDRNDDGQKAGQANPRMIPQEAKLRFRDFRISGFQDFRISGFQDFDDPTKPREREVSILKAFKSSHS
jgi:hypothetical protein